MAISACPTTHRTLALAAALCTAISAAGGGIAAAQTPAPAPSAPGAVTTPAERALIDAVPPQTLTWAPCATNASVECATLTVPLSWEKPAGEQVALQVMRRKASEKSVGTLVAHYGNPGTSTSSFVQHADEDIDPALMKRFDLVGVQNRGALAKPALRCFSTFVEEEFNKKAREVIPQSGLEWENSLDAARTLGAACAEKSKGLAETFSVWSQARDHEVLRKALGEEKISLVTGLFGSVFGQVYASMFPERVRAMVLDVPFDAASYLGQNKALTLVEATQTGAAMHHVFATMINRCEEAGPTLCSLAAAKGTTWKKVDQVLDAMKLSPVPVGDGSQVGYTDFISSLDFQLRDAIGMKVIADSLQEAYLSLQGVPARKGGALSTLQRQLTQRRAALAARTTSAARHGNTAATRQEQDEYDNAGNVGIASTCIDHTVNLPLEGFPARFRAMLTKHPYVGAQRLEEEFACAADVWTLKPSQPFAGTVGKTLVTPPLVVTNTYNIYSHPDQAARIVKGFPGAGLLTAQGAWGVGPERTPNGCLDKTVAQYLVNAALPVGEALTCAATWQPFDGSAVPSEPRHGVGGQEYVARRLR